MLLEREHNMKSKKISSAMEDYLKIVLVLSEKNKIVRIKDIAKEKECKNSSANYAINNLKDMGLVEHERYGCVFLTEEGQALGRQLFNKFSCLTNFFHKILAVDLTDAYVVACQMEHYTDRELKQRFSNFLLFYEKEERLNREWVERHKKFLCND